MKKTLVIGLVLSSFALLPMEPLIKNPTEAEKLEAVTLSDSPSEKQSSELLEDEAQDHEDLFLALQSGSTEKAKHLIKQCSNLSIRNKQGLALLICAVEAIPKKRYRCNCGLFPSGEDCDFGMGCGPIVPSNKELAPYVEIIEAIIAERSLRTEKDALPNLMAALLCFNKICPRFIPSSIRLSILCLNEERCKDLATLVRKRIVNLTMIPVAFYDKILRAANYLPVSLEKEMIKAQKIAPTGEVKDLLNPNKYTTKTVSQ